MRKSLHYEPLLFLLIISYFGCHPLIRTRPDPFDKSFFDKARLIMTQDEIKLYKSLDGEEQIKEFIREFWRIRDPYPETDENENKIEFERRILYANEWFDRHRSRRRDFQSKSARGWQSTKGRVYILLGTPDNVNYGDGKGGPIKKYPPQDAIYESWYYSIYDFTVCFERERIESKLESVPARGSEEDDRDIPSTYVSKVVGSGGWKMIPDFKIIDAFEVAKLNWISPQYRSDVQNGLRFNAKYARDRILIKIPSDKVIFIDEDGKLKVYLQVEILVNRGEIKEFEITENKILSFSQDEVLELLEIIVEVPYTPTKKGEYSFDVTVTDLKAEYLSKYRQLIKHVF